VTAGAGSPVWGLAAGAAMSLLLHRRATEPAP
jgi:hypothetical protein